MTKPCTCTYKDVMRQFKDQGIDPQQYNFLSFTDQIALHIKWGLCPELHRVKRE